MAKRIGSNIIFENDFFKTKVGTLDKKAHRIMYLEIGGFIKIDDDDVRLPFRDLNKEIEREIWRNIVKSNKFQKDYISKIDVSENRITVEKSTYLEIQIFLKLTDPNISDTFKGCVKETTTDINNILESIYNTISQNGYVLTKRRK